MDLPHNDSRAVSLLSFIYIPFAFTTLILVLRLYVRLKMCSHGIDDYLMVGTWLLWIATIAVTTVYIENGGARHVYYIAPEKIPAVIRDSLIAQALGVLTPALGKMSVAAVMVRLLGKSTSVWKWLLWSLYIIMAIYMVMSLLVVVFVFAQCSPTAALWDTTITNAHCWKKLIYVDYSIAQSSVGTFIDFLLALAPSNMIRKLNMSRKDKMGLCVLFGLGTFAGVCAAMKTVKLQEFANVTDFTWNTYEVFVWAQAEVFIVIICGYLPTLTPLYQHIRRGGGKPVGQTGSRYQYRSTSHRMANSFGSAVNHSTASRHGGSSFIIKTSDDTDGEQLVTYHSQPTDNTVSGAAYIPQSNEQKSQKYRFGKYGNEPDEV